MASTRTLLQTVNWASTFTKLIPIIGVGGYQLEPALTICNNVLQELLSAPFNWKFNQIIAPPFLTSTLTNQQDYPLAITNCAWLESATMIQTSSTQQPPPLQLLETVRDLQPSDQVSDPEKVSYFNETSDGIVVRFWPVPAMGNQNTVSLVYQAKPPIKTSLSDTWAPFPDELAYVLNQGFLAGCYEQAEDPRYDAAYKKFEFLIQKALGSKDMENNSDGFFPSSPLMMG